MELINKTTGETIATITTNHRMTIEEALHIVGAYQKEGGMDIPDYTLGDMEIWVEEIEIAEYDKNMFESMVKEFITDRGEEMDDIVIDSTSITIEGWKCYAHDDKNTYVLFDDGTNNIEIEYLGTK